MGAALVTAGLLAALGATPVDTWDAQVDFHIGATRLELTGLERQLADIGLGRSHRHYAVLGLGGRVGAEGLWLVAETSILARDDLGGDDGAPFTGFGLVGVGATIVDLPRFEVTPTFSLGAVRARFSALDPEADERVPVSATAALLSIDVDAQVVVPLPSDRSIRVGVRAGYMFALAHSDWTVQESVDLDAGADARFSGPRLMLTIGGGLSLRRGD